MSKETSKALRRRWVEDASGDLPWKWRDIFKGKGIDVGAGDDPLPFDNCITFDQEQGDANKLSSYFEPKSFDYVHASQCLEHMYDPEVALDDWLKIVKSGGHLIFTVPDLGLYEQFRFPSRYNPDHKSSFSFLYRNSPFPKHVYFDDFLKKFHAQAEVLLARLIVANYDWHKGCEADQTWLEQDGVELWNEVVLRKK